jgi:CheY-like chemotaxis protein
MPSVAAERPCVLIVEDDQDIRETLAEILVDEGYRVAGVADGAAALEMLRITPSPCLILLDLMMPVMNGWEFRTRQLGDPSLRDIPTALITGVGEVAQKAAALGTVDAFGKPIDIERLLDTVRRHCG